MRIYLAIRSKELFTMKFLYFFFGLLLRVVGGPQVWKYVIKISLLQIFFKTSIGIMFSKFSHEFFFKYTGTTFASVNLLHTIQHKHTNYHHLSTWKSKFWMWSIKSFPASLHHSKNSLFTFSTYSMYAMIIFVCITTPISIPTCQRII